MKNVSLFEEKRWILLGSEIVYSIDDPDAIFITELKVVLKKRSVLEVSLYFADDEKIDLVGRINKRERRRRRRLEVDIFMKERLSRVLIAIDNADIFTDRHLKLHCNDHRDLSIPDFLRFFGFCLLSSLRRWKKQ